MLLVNALAPVVVVEELVLRNKLKNSLNKDTVRSKSSKLKNNSLNKDTVSSKLRNDVLLVNALAPVVVVEELNSKVESRADTELPKLLMAGVLHLKLVFVVVLKACNAGCSVSVSPVLNLLLNNLTDCSLVLFLLSRTKFLWASFWPAPSPQRRQLPSRFSPLWLTSTLAEITRIWATRDLMSLNLCKKCMMPSTRRLRTSSLIKEINQKECNLEKHHVLLLGSIATQVRALFLRLVPCL